MLTAWKFSDDDNNWPRVIPSEREGPLNLFHAHRKLMTRDQL
jgi:hypothetical protein